MLQTSKRAAAKTKKTRTRKVQTPEFSFIIPCLNESATLPICINRAKKMITHAELRAEIVVGDNGSTDGSQEIARKLGARVIQVPEKGYGAAVFAASTAAKGQYLIMGDADDSYHFDEIEPFITALRNGYDLVMGNRFAGGIEAGAMPWKNRYIGNPILSFIGRLLFRCPVRDFHCGLRGFSKDAFHKMDLRTTGMEFASEMVIKAALRKMRITEVPVRLYKDGRGRPSHLRPWRDGWRHLRFMLLYSPRWLFLYPGLILMAVGIAMGAFIYPEMRRIGGIYLDVHTLLYATAMFLIGFQAVLYSYLAKSFAIRENLLNPDRWTQIFERFFRLEIGVVFGFLAFAAGITLALTEFVQWQNSGFGQLEVSKSMRNTIASATLMVLGIETIFFSFYASFLKLNTRLQ